MKHGAKDHVTSDHHAVMFINPVSTHYSYKIL